jgi:hypothetical protein
MAHRYAVWIGAALLAVAGGWGLRANAGAGDKAPPKSLDKATVMKRKLIQAQKFLEGLALHDFEKIGSAAAELAELRKEASWMVIKTRDYEMFSVEFSRQIEAAAKAAKAKNIDAAALAYMDMTMTCVKCHKYVRETGIAAAPLPAAPAVGR